MPRLRKTNARSQRAERGHQKEVRIGVSACLLGQKVRYNGKHKRHAWIVNFLKKHASLIPVCPEVEMGLGVPRETMALRKGRLVTTETDKDLTSLAHKTNQTLLKRLGHLDAFIFKKNSPSCGLSRGGLFAKSSPILLGSPILVEEDALSDRLSTETFLACVRAWHQFHNLESGTASLQKFHAQNKYLLMALSPAKAKQLGKIAALGKGNYREVLLEILQTPPSIPRWVNALEHMAGYFKKCASAAERERLQQKITRFSTGQVALSAVSKAIFRLAQHHDVLYLKNERFLRSYAPRKPSDI